MEFFVSKVRILLFTCVLLSNVRFANAGSCLSVEDKCGPPAASLSPHDPQGPHLTAADALTPTEGLVKTIPILNTDFSTQIKFGSRMDFQPPQLNAVRDMSSRLAKLGAAIGKNVPPPRVDLWGTTENSVKFEIRETAHFMEGPRQPIYGDFLKAFSRTIGRLFNGGNGQANLRFEGTVYSSTLTPVLTYRLYPIDPSTTRSTKATGVDFNGGDIDIIFDVKSQILRYTRPIDIILFIGNTAAYFYYAFTTMDDRDCHLVPLSGELFSTAPQVPLFTLAGLKTWTNFVLRPAFNPPPLSETRIVLIGHSDDGLLPKQMSTVLEKYVKLIRKHQEIFFINLVYPSQEQRQPLPHWPAWNLLNVFVGGNDDANFQRLEQAQVGKLLPYYPPDYWEVRWQDVPNPDAQLALDIQRRISAAATASYPTRPIRRLHEGK